MQRFGLIGLAMGFFACGGHSLPSAATPTEGPADGLVEPALGEQALLGPADPIVPEPPARCTADLPLISAAEPNACSENLAAAIQEAVSQNTVKQLLRLEGCAGVEPGLMRAVVAELSPAECADVLVLSTGAAERPPSAAMQEVLTGLGIAARLSRLAGEPPHLAPPYEMARFKRFLDEELAPWIIAQARAIDQLSQQGAALRGYAQGVVAIQAGLADLRMVELLRAVELPQDMAGDSELEDVYYSTLDQTLEPRKTRGRDAALVGLRRFRETGVIEDDRLAQAHRLLSMLYNGRRVDRLQMLFLPHEIASGADAALAGGVPVFYLEKFFSDEELRALLPKLMRRGLPMRLQQSVEKPGAEALPPTLQLNYALALARFSQQYFSEAEMKRAGEIGARLASQPGEAGEQGRFFAALARAFVGAPKDAAQMMLNGLGGWQPDVSALDQVAAGSGAYAGMAGYNAAYLLELTAPGDAPAELWRELGERYGKAAAQLSGRPQTIALAAKSAAEQTAEAIARQN